MHGSGHEELIGTLAGSFRRQGQAYRELADLARAIAGRLALARGDVSGMMDSFRKKQQLLEVIANEREAVAPLTGEWIALKPTLPHSAAVQELDTILDDTGRVMKEFLDSEAQVQKLLEHHMRKAAPDGR